MYRSYIMEGEELGVDNHNRLFGCNVYKKTFNLKCNLNKDSFVHEKETPCFVCNVCDKEFSKKSNFDHHKKIHSAIKCFECTVCKEYFESRSTLKLHQETHKTNRTADFHSKECGKSFLHKKSLYSHGLMHLDPPESFKCRFCDRKFRLKHICKRHELSHNFVNEKFSCQTCGNQYLTSINLHNHSLLHRKKSFICKQCPKAFTLLIHLERHERWHKNENAPCIYKTCNKTFSSDSRVKNYRRICNDEECSNIFIFCDKCGKRFTQKSHLKLHTLRGYSACKTQKTKNLVACDKCDKMYSRNFLKEPLTHGTDDESPLLCPICHQKFAHKQYLRNYTVELKKKDTRCVCLSLAPRYNSCG